MDYEPYILQGLTK